MTFAVHLIWAWFWKHGLPAAAYENDEAVNDYYETTTVLWRQWVLVGSACAYEYDLVVTTPTQ